MSSVAHFNVPTLNAVNAAFGLGNVYDKFMLLQIEQNLDLAHAMVACMKVARDILGRPGGLIGSDVLVHKSKAITLFRKRLLDPEAAINDSAMLTVLFLGFLESSLGDMAAHQIHHDQLGRMISARGGTENVIAARGLIATATQSAPQLDTPIPLTYPGRPLPRDYRAFVSPLPPGFRELAHTGTVSWETTRVLIRIATIQALEQRSFPFAGAGPELLRKFHKDYHEAAPVLSMRDGPGGPSLERLLQVVLMRYLINATEHDRLANGIFHSLTGYLTQKLGAFDLSRLSLLERECLMWMHLVVVDSWIAAPRTMAYDGQRFLRETWLRFPDVKLWEQEQWNTFSRRYFWSEGLENITRNLWKK